jgi:hypothetical protein
VNEDSTSDIDLAESIEFVDIHDRAEDKNRDVVIQDLISKLRGAEQKIKGLKGQVADFRKHNSKTQTTKPPKKGKQKLFPIGGKQSKGKRRNKNLTLSEEDLSIIHEESTTQKRLPNKYVT